MEIRFTAKARNGLAEIEEFIAQDSPRRAKAFVDRLIRSMQRLRYFPYSGALLIRDPAYRLAVIHGYRVVYRLGDGKIVIVAIVAPGRRLEAALDLDDDRP